MGEDNGFSVLTDEKVRDIRRARIETDLTLEQLAEKFEVNYNTLLDIVYYRRWHHIQLETP